jgi:hypothetical protein
LQNPWICLETPGGLLTDIVTMKKMITVAMALLLATPAWAEGPARLRLPEGARTGERAAQIADTARWQTSPTHRRSHAKQGAVIGALALGVGGAVVGNGICQIAEESQSCGNGGMVAGFTVVSAAVGAGLGALIGLAIKK